MPSFAPAPGKLFHCFVPLPAWNGEGGIVHSVFTQATETYGSKVVGKS